MESAGKITISDSIGEVSYLVNAPQHQKAVVVLAHGAGAGMTHRFMETLSIELAGLGIGTVRYNFPYIEKGKKRPDMPAVAEKTVGVVSDHVQKLFPGVPLFLGGKSFGGRMSSQYISKKNSEKIKGIVFYGFPLHAPGAPSMDRAEHLKNVHIPMLFLQGTKDTLADLSLIEKVCSELPTATLVKFEGADHSFKVKKSELIQPLASNTAKWIENV
jgi:predicted alpha/beta-hydrolase family hydrolase